MADKNVSEAIVPIAHLRYIILIIGSTGIIVIVAVAVLISKKITASIDNAVEVARRIAKHDLENPIMNYKSMDDLSKPGKLINLELNKHRKENFHNNYSFSFTLPLTCAFNK